MDLDHQTGRQSRISNHNRDSSVDLPLKMSSLDLTDNIDSFVSNHCSESVETKTAAYTNPLDTGTTSETGLVDDVELPRRQFGTGSGRNRLSRVSKSGCLMKINRRSSLKPQRKVASSSQDPEDDIKKFYLNNRANNVKNSPLETIFEEPTMVKNELKFVGLRKIKRAITFKTGHSLTKATVMSRRKKVKSLFNSTGSKKFKKMSMDAFLQHLQEISAVNNTEGDNSHSL